MSPDYKEKSSSEMITSTIISKNLLKIDSASYVMQHSKVKKMRPQTMGVA